VLCALRAWTRVLKPGGVIFAAIPNMLYTFDRDRKGPTPFSHFAAEASDEALLAGSVLRHAMEANIKEAADTPGRAMDEAQAKAFLRGAGVV